MMEKNIPGVLLVGGGVIMKGSIDAPETIVSSGKIEGDIKAYTILVEEGGDISGEINANLIDVAGIARDNLTAQESLIVRSTGRVDGNITYSELSLEKGGKISGTLNVLSGSDTSFGEVAFPIPDDGANLNMQDVDFEDGEHS